MILSKVLSEQLMDKRMGTKHIWTNSKPVSAKCSKNVLYKIFQGKTFQKYFENFQLKKTIIADKKKNFMKDKKLWTRAKLRKMVLDSQLYAGLNI